MRFDSNGKLFLDWNDVQLAASAVASRIEEHNFKPARILGIARGGLIPAAMIAHQLGVEEVGSLQLKSYTGHEQDKVHAQYYLNLRAAGLNNFQYWGAFAEKWDKPDTLVVDDLWDTGNTHAWIRQMFPDVATSTLFYKDKPENSPNAHKVVSFPGAPLGNHWIVFPWERE